MEDLHPGFRNRASIVLHRHATDPEVEERLKKIGYASRRCRLARRSRC